MRRLMLYEVGAFRTIVLIGGYANFGMEGFFGAHVEPSKLNCGDIKGKDNSKVWCLVNAFMRKSD